MAQDFTTEPLSGIDVGTKDFLLDVRFIVRGLLDSEKLLDALCDLITIKWPVIGSRMVKGPDGRIVLQTPRSFDGDKNQPVLFDAFEADSSTPITRCFARLPDLSAATTATVALSNPLELRDDAYDVMHRVEPTSTRAKQCAAAKHGPIRVRGSDIYTDGGPNLTCLVHSFPHSGETVIRLLLSHVIFDATGIGALLRGWSLVLNGKINEVADVLTLDQAPAELYYYAGEDDPRAVAKRAGKVSKVTESIAPTAHFRPPFGFHVLTFVSLVVFLLGLLWRKLLLPLLRLRVPKGDTAVVIWVPRGVLEAWRNEAAQVASGGYLSDNDLAVSWAVERMAQRRRLRLDGTLCLLTASNIRTQYDKLADALGIDVLGHKSRTMALRHARKVYWHNGVIALRVATLRWSEISKMPPWTVARLSRLSVEAGRTEQGVQAAVQSIAGIHEAYAAPKPLALLPWAPSDEGCITTNWLQASPREAIDFAAAVLEKVEADPPTQWATATAHGRSSELFVTSTKDPVLPLKTVCIFDQRKAQGVFVAVLTDRTDIQAGVFGKALDLLAAPLSA